MKHPATVSKPEIATLRRRWFAKLASVGWWRHRSRQSHIHRQLDRRAIPPKNGIALREDVSTDYIFRTERSFSLSAINRERNAPHDRQSYLWQKAIPKEKE
jgi:hypothetical protein